MDPVLTAGQMYGAAALACSLIFFGLFAFATLRDVRQRRQERRQAIPIDRGRRRAG